MEGFVRRRGNPKSGVAIATFPVGTKIKADDTRSFIIVAQNHSTHPENSTCLWLYGVTEETGYQNQPANMDKNIFPELPSAVQQCALSTTYKEGFVPYSGSPSAGGTSTYKLFKLSSTEVGNSISGMPTGADGVRLEYFSTDATNRRKLGAKYPLRTRSQYSDGSYYSYSVSTSGLVAKIGISDETRSVYNYALCVTNTALVNPSPNADGSYNFIG